eukprot:TRINITY_DN6041_c0_g1_i1.p1 TRINITY_DN6041_c0_g1~~TRINITY_DN6041_c0_g1_i1.p1  ORF type:complete len:593 (-),score=108.70 TRINITY_DN6041_c0_g1_i1:521-2299(-)
MDGFHNELQAMIASHGDKDPDTLLKVLKILDPSLDDAVLAQVMQASGNNLEALCKWLFDEQDPPSTKRQPPDRAKTWCQAAEKEGTIDRSNPRLDGMQVAAPSDALDDRCADAGQNGSLAKSSSETAAGKELDTAHADTSQNDSQANALSDTQVGKALGEAEAQVGVACAPPAKQLPDPDKPSLQIIPEKVLNSLGPEGEDVTVLIRLHQQEGAGTVRTPSDIICVLDVSGSMGAPAKTANSEASGLSLLDVALHGIKTVVNTLEAQDRLAVVLFDHSHEVLFELMAMDEDSRTSAQAKLNQVTTRGATDIWGGLKAGLEVCKRGQVSKDSSTKRLAHLMLLTDGQTADRNKVIPSMLDYQAMHERLPCTVSTMGFGYQIDSPLLAEMAKHGSGSYSFIPDAGFVGTIFVNLMSNLLVTMAQQVSLIIAPEEDAVIKHIYGDFKVTQTGCGTQVELGTLQYGQSKDIIVQMCLKTQGEYLTAQATYELPGSSGQREQTEFVAALTQTIEGDIKQVPPQLFRAKFADTLACALQECQQHFSKDTKAMLTELSREIKGASGNSSDQCTTPKQQQAVCTRPLARNRGGSDCGISR